MLLYLNCVLGAIQGLHSTVQVLGGLCEKQSCFLGNELVLLLVGK